MAKTEEKKDKKEKKEKPKAELWHGMRGSKYKNDVRDKCIEELKAGKSPREISKSMNGHPNPLAIVRYGKAAGVEIPKAVRQKKDKKDKKDKKKKDKEADTEDEE